eukprot:TRINITY_DN6597_c0_g1_i2.p1 TRINITY_DN6597_c0_g1~~TRINITY_DN6597_c0_g1_i2.p1  ORF type:complete len:544 (+),score=98.77 TRINITY_DN6597_c0_g1_i2:163-1794(+)
MAATQPNVAVSIMNTEVIMQNLRIQELKNVLRKMNTRITGNRASLLDRIRGVMMDSTLATECRKALEFEYVQKNQGRIYSTAPAHAVAPRAMPPQPSHKLIAWPFFVNAVSVMAPRVMTSGTPGAWNFAFSFRIRLSSYQLNLLGLTNVTPRYRVYLRCGYKRRDKDLLYDQFPRNGQWTINNKPTKDKLSLRCRPYDITDYLRPSQYGPINSNVVVEAKRTTQQPQSFDTSVVEIVIAQERKVDDLFATIQQRDVASGITFVKERLHNPADAEIISAAEDKVGLTCPFTCTRIKHPARGRHCRHVQCFDARNFLAMNERKPDWACPVCNHPITLGELYIDGWTRDILAQAPANSDTVFVKQDATWEYIISSSASSPAASPPPAASMSRTQPSAALPTIPSTAPIAQQALPVAPTTTSSIHMQPAFDAAAFNSRLMDDFDDDELAELAALIEEDHSRTSGQAMPPSTGGHVHSQVSQAVQASLHAASQLTHAASALQSSYQAHDGPPAQRARLMGQAATASTAPPVGNVFGNAGSKHDPILLD